MRAASCLLAIVVAAAAAACDPYPYGTRGYDYGPSFDRVPGYQPGSGSASAGSSSASKWDYYRNYQGSFHRGPQTYP